MPVDVVLSNSGNLLYVSPGNEHAMVWRVHEGCSKQARLGFLIHVCFSVENKT